MIVDTVIYKGNNINIHSYTKQAKGTVYTYYRARLIVEKGKTISIQGNTIEECKNKIYYAINIHAFVPGYNNLEITIGEAMPAWLKMRYANGRPSTYIRYKATMKHIIEYTGQKRIQNLSPEDVQSFADHLSSISLSGVYIHAAISLLKRFLQEYVDRGEIPYNPCLHVQMPTIDTPEASPFTKKDIQIILDNLSGTKYKNAIKLSLLTAMRIGEVLGLTWDKVDFANKTITIDQQIHHGSSEILPYVKNHNPKTVHYPQEVFDLLSEVKQQQDSLARFAGELWDNPSNLIFTTEFGKPIPHPSILEAFKKAAEPTGRKSRRIHDLRHTTLSYIWEDTHDIDKVMQVSRHKNRLSARVYIHPTEKTQEEAAALISSVAKKLNIVLSVHEHHYDNKAVR